MIASALARVRPRPEELASLAERAAWLAVVRAALVAFALGFALAMPEALGATAGELAAGSGAFLASTLLVHRAVERLPRGAALWLIGASLLLDGVFLAWVTYATGGTQSPLRVLVGAHVVAVTLLGSFRTGLKLAAWHSLLLPVTLFAQSSGLVPVREAARAALPGGTAFSDVLILQTSALWAIALVTAACSAAIERDLRGQKVDLEELARLVRELDGRASVAEIPGALLDALVRTFGFARGVVLASPAGELEVAASAGAADVEASSTGRDRAIERAWDERRTQLVRELDPETDPRLAALLPGARDVLVVPLCADGDPRVGVAVLEHRGRRHRVKRWVVAMVEQFAAHAALALHAARLHEQLEQRLLENRELQRQLVEQNLGLEVKVRERTADLAANVHELEVVDEQRRRLLERLVHAEEEERRRIAGDIHDDPIQKMCAATMRLQVLRRTVTEPDRRREIDTALETLKMAIQSLRHMIFELRPLVLDDAGLAPAIEDYLESLDASFSFTVESRVEREPDPDVRVVLYRMAQEALANVHKHAEAEHVTVLLADRDGGVLVRIADDGVGFVAGERARSERGHLGLTSLRERAEMAGGWSRILSLPGKGTTVELWVPGSVAQAPVAAAVGTEPASDDSGIRRIASAALGSAPAGR